MVDFSISLLWLILFKKNSIFVLSNDNNVYLKWWRETLFVWKGDGSFDEQNNNMQWEGKWCGTDQPDEKHFPKENEFKESKMLFFSVNMIVIIMRKISNIRFRYVRKRLVIG